MCGYKDTGHTVGAKVVKDGSKRSEEREREREGWVIKSCFDNGR